MPDPEKPTIAFNDWLKKLASPSIVFFSLPWLMILLIAGTIAQKDIGLYASQKMFFSSWIFWAGPFPLPGGYLTIGLITACLLAKFLFYSPWSKNRMGTIITHLGVLVLLIGGIVTAFSQQEGYIVLPEGGESSQVSDYHQRALLIERDNTPLLSIPFGDLKAGEDLKDTGLPFSIRIEKICRNCRPVPLNDAADRQGIAAKIRLDDAPPEKENEANLSGATFRIIDAPDKQDGIYAVLEEVPERPVIEAGDSSYRLSMVRAATVLPFSLRLVDFTKEVYPGTNMARAYSSQVIVKEGNMEWPYHIEMNKPLRYKGYTIYQTSFSENADGVRSILSVVTNKGRIFPYIATAIIFAGLLLHIVIRLQARKGIKL